jgi:hypothetical protein
MFAVLPRRTAIVTSFLVAWLFLPVAGYEFSGLPNYTKITATCIGVLLGTLLFDTQRIATLRIQWFDVPMFLWCVAPFASSLTAGYGAYDGLSGTLNQVITWGIPYFMGRLRFGDLGGLKYLILALVIGGLIYTPLCLWEVRMSPHLHQTVYGFHQHSFLQTKRIGGFRPMVFMQHGLAVGMFMSMAALASFGLWITRSQRQLLGFPLGWATGLLVGTSVLCKSTGAIVLMATGVLTLLASRYLKTSILLICALGLPVLYMTARTVGGWDGQELVDLTAFVEPERSQSLQFRMRSEDGVWSLVQQDISLGRARFNFASDGTSGLTKQRIIGDGLWIIALGKFGVIGLMSLTVACVLPPLMFMKRWPAAVWTQPTIAPAAVTAIIIAFMVIDNLFNAMINPLFVVAIGALAGCSSTGSEVALQGFRNHAAPSVQTARVLTSESARSAP